MNMKTVKTEKAPKAIGPYSQGIVSGGMVYTSGQLGLDPVSGVLPEGIILQAEQSCKNVGEILKAAGSDYSRVIKVTVFLKNLADFGIVNEIYAKYFISNPARSCVEVSKLPKGGLIEIEAVAEL